MAREAYSLRPKLDQIFFFNQEKNDERPDIYSIEFWKHAMSPGRQPFDKLVK